MEFQECPLKVRENPYFTKETSDHPYFYNQTERRKFFVEGQLMDRMMNQWLESPLSKPL